MDGVCPQRHGGTVEQLKQQMDRDIECQRIRGQPQQCMTAALVLCGPEGGQQILRVKGQLILGGGEEVCARQICVLQVGDPQTRQH